MTFLEQAATHIFKQHSLNDLAKLSIVLPTRRSVSYFKRALAKLSEDPFIAPEVQAVDDFVMSFSGLREMDNISLLFEMYDVFKKIEPDTSFDRYMTWAPTLLKDFDTIDQYLVDNPKALFEYISDVKAMERWQLDLDQRNVGCTCGLRQ